MSSSEPPGQASIDCARGQEQHHTNLPMCTTSMITKQNAILRSYIPTGEPSLSHEPPGITTKHLCPRADPMRPNSFTFRRPADARQQHRTASHDALRSLGSVRRHVKRRWQLVRRHLKAPEACRLHRKEVPIKVLYPPPTLNHTRPSNTAPNIQEPILCAVDISSTCHRPTTTCVLSGLTACQSTQRIPPRALHLCQEQSSSETQTAQSSSETQTTQ